MPWRKGKDEGPARGGGRANPLTAALIVAVVVLLLVWSTRGGTVDIGLGEDYALSQGRAVYEDENVTFTFVCFAPRRIDFEELRAEIVLLSDGSVVSIVTSNDSVSLEDLVLPELRGFLNVTVPHMGHDKMALGSILTLTYRGILVDQYYFDRIPWDE